MHTYFRNNQPIFSLFVSSCYFTILSLSIVAFTFSHVLADGVSPKSNSQATGQVPAEDIDPRLPPVIPGQAVTAGGKKHVVISTAGPVPVSPPPAAPVAPSNCSDPHHHLHGANCNSGAGVAGTGVGGVIVDRRKDKDY